MIVIDGICGGPSNHDLFRLVVADTLIAGRRHSLDLLLWQLVLLCELLAHLRGRILVYLPCITVVLAEIILEDVCRGAIRLHKAPADSFLQSVLDDFLVTLIQRATLARAEGGRRPD